jgi:hypothetical protein
MTTGITIYRRDGTVAFIAEKATTMCEAVEQAAKSRADLTGANLTGANLYGADLYGANLTGAYLYGAKGVHYATIGPIDGWMVSLTLTSGGLRISAGCRYFSVPEARDHWSNPARWSSGASPEHGARMLAAVDALMALTVDWPEKLPEVSR